MIYTTENGVAVPYSNLSDNIAVDADQIDVVDTYGLVTTAGGTTDEQSMTDAQNSHIAKLEVLVVSTGNTVVTSLPYTFNDAAIETDMVCLKAELGTPSSQLSDWTVNTDTAGQAVVSGTIASTGTTIKLYLMKSR